MARTKAAKAPKPAPEPTADLPIAEPPPKAEGFALLRHEQIWIGALNPRKDFDAAGLAELADSIAAEGLLQPLLVRPGAPADDETASHQLVAGERRWRAIGALIADGRWAAERPIACTVQDIDDEAHAIRALVENLQRRDLKPLEEAEALKRLAEVAGLGTAEIATRIGFTQRFVQQRLQLLDLDDRGRILLSEGKLTIEQARQRLANRPTIREDITPAGWLILLELVDLAQRTGKGPCDSVEVGPEIREDADWQALKESYGYLCHGPSPQWDAGFETGRYTASVSSYEGHGQLELKFPDAFTSEEGMQRALAEARGAAGVDYPLGFEPGRYATPWLNGPWEVAPDVLAKIEQAKADRARQEADRVERERAANARIGEAFNVVQSIMVQHRKAERPALDARIGATWDALGLTPPFAVNSGGDVVDAKGEALVRGGYYPRGAPPSWLARQRLIALALNAAAGLHTPDAPPEDEEDVPSRDEFLGAVAGFLMDEVYAADAGDDLDGEAEEAAQADARARAERGLAAYLAQEEIAYGDPAYDWEETGALALAKGILNEGLGQQIDLEEAIACTADGNLSGPLHGDGSGEALPPIDDDAEISPALAALATGHAAKITAPEVADHD